jgi:tripartite-type tricarboxylate transporter receptor subunit TctC
LPQSTSLWRGIAGGPDLNPVGVKFIDDALKELLASQEVR